jgi:hypothetical protein
MRKLQVRSSNGCIQDQLRGFPLVCKPLRRHQVLTGPRIPSLTVEVSFTGETAECVICGGLDPASTPALADMLTLVLDRHPRKLVLHTTGKRVHRLRRPADDRRCHPVAARRCAAGDRLAQPSGARAAAPNRTAYRPRGGLV